jgi:hypothetical protein
MKEKTMKRYEVRITAYVETTEVVMADNEEHACMLAEQQFGEVFTVYNADVETYKPFDDILGFEPQELA